MHDHLAGVINKFVEVTDVDGVVRRIDVNHAVQRIEWNDVVQKIEWNDVVQKINWNDMLSTIDWNQQLARIDFDTVLESVDTNSILVRSSTGIFTTFLDTLRTQLVLIDLYLWIVSRCRIRRRWLLPPVPGHRQRTDRDVYPKGRTNKAVAVQGRYCGFMSKAIAILIDVLCITLLFALQFRIVDWLLIVFTSTSQESAAKKTKAFKDERDDLMVLLYCILWFGYFFLTVLLAGQTAGMMLVGLKVCNCDRSDPYSSVSVLQTLLRTCLLPITLTFLPPLGCIGLVRRDGRMLHDYVANTGIIYLWDAKLAKLRHKALRPERSESTVSENEDESDALDHLMATADSDHHEEEEPLLGSENTDESGEWEPTQNYSAVV